jgi:hypothetical protein
LLNQSDIFSHFGVKEVRNDSKDTSDAEVPGKRGRKPGKKSLAHAEDELDDDELAMLEEEDEEDGGDASTPSKTPHTAALVRQPSCIVGGQMRYF